MATNELGRRAGVAIRLAFHRDQAAHDQLEAYVEEMADADVDALRAAARHLEATASYILGRRQT